jgi:hypothetical protein
MTKTTGIDAEALEMLNTKPQPEIGEVVMTAEEIVKLQTPMTEEEMMDPAIVPALVHEIQEAGKRAIQYKHELDTAQTNTKRRHYEKRLKRNNEEAADVIIALERIIKVREQHEANANAEGDVVQNGPREESSN